MAYRARVGVQLAVLLSASLLWCATVPGQTRPGGMILRVALFPYLPDAADDKFEEFSARIEREFEAGR